jgi:predicted SprT family Zn-dependent metalloprotease
VELFITDNATSLFSMRPARDGGVTVRLHHMFLRADDEVLGELARYVRSGRGSTPRFWGFVKAHTHLLKEATPRRTSIETEGSHHDLREIFDRLNAEHFGGELACAVTWGRRPRSGRVRARRTLGSYAPHGNTIRISPILDSARVPRYFVEYIVYHEMLHARLGVKMKNGRRALHTREFKELERRFPHYTRAIAWERRHGF